MLPTIMSLQNITQNHRGKKSFKGLGHIYFYIIHYVWCKHTWDSWVPFSSQKPAGSVCWCFRDSRHTKDSWLRWRDRLPKTKKKNNNWQVINKLTVRNRNTLRSHKNFHMLIRTRTVRKYMSNFRLWRFRWQYKHGILL